MLQPLRETCRRLLEDGTVQVVIGYGQAVRAVEPYPVFITDPDEVGQLVWNEQCRTNLVKYLLRKEIRALGKPAIVVKGCDERALVVLEQESQIDRSQVVVIGMACEGMAEPRCEVLRRPPAAVRRRYDRSGGQRGAAGRAAFRRTCTSSWNSP